MSARVFIACLPFALDDDGLRTLVEPFGEVRAVEIILNHDGHSRGFGYATFAKDDDARRAIEGLNGSELEGRRLHVEPARPRPTRRA